MAFPTVIATAAYQSGASNLSSWPVFTGRATTAGRMLVMVVGSDASPTLSATGWTKLGQTQGSLTVGAIFWKISAGGNESFTLTSTVAEQFSAVLYEISGADAIGGTGSSGDSANSDPPLHTAAASRDHLWLAIRTGDTSTGGNATAAPAGYSALTAQTGTGSGAHVAVAHRTATAQAENPGAFTSASEQWVCYTLAISGPDVVAREYVQLMIIG